MLALPPALAGLAEYRQFLLYKIVPGIPRADGKPVKDRKISLHPYTLRAVDAHDPSVWVSAQEACALAAAHGKPYGVAFSVQPSDPFFFIDIDKAWNGTEWSPLAQQLCAMFPGAAIEVSQSGTGLHIFGRGVVPLHSCKNVPLGIELYTEYRFAALTGTGATGDVNSDHTAALAHLVGTYFPPIVGDGIREEGWTEAPVPEWRGPTDDAELLRRAMQSRGAGAVFGGRAAFADLWNANEGPLAVSYPDPDRGYDASSADAALAQHLCFWTGKDMARVERLMRQSALVRDKWDRYDRVYGSYLGRTITRAAGMARDVLQDKPMEPLAGAPAPLVAPNAPTPAVAPAGPTPAPVAIDTSPRPAAITGNTYLTPAQQMDFFAGCVYVSDVHGVLVPGGYLRKPDRFKVLYGGYSFVMDATNSKVTKDAWEAFTLSQCFRAPRAERTCFRPDMPPGAIVTDGSRTEVNLWWPSGARRAKGDPTPFLRHVALLVPNEWDRIVVLSYLAALVQLQGTKFQWCPIIQGAEGNGKTILSRCVAEAIGQRYTHWVRADLISEKFNAWLTNRTFIGVEDIYVPESKREVWEALKPMITGEFQAVEPKGVDQDVRNICANFLLNSNFRNAVRKTANDRRLAYIYTAQQNEADVRRDMGSDYFPNLWRWLKQEDGFAIVADFLDTYRIDSSIDLQGRAPTTSSRAEAIEASRGNVEQEVMECVVQGKQGFRGGWISSMAFDKLLDATHMASRIPRNNRKEVLEGLGYFYHPALADGRVNNDVLPDAGKPRLYLRQDNPAWNLTGPAEVAKAYSAAQVN